jgi:hypothetical protein
MTLFPGWGSEHEAHRTGLCHGVTHRALDPGSVGVVLVIGQVLAVVRSTLLRRRPTTPSEQVRVSPYPSRPRRGVEFRKTLARLSACESGGYPRQG